MDHCEALLVFIFIWKWFGNHLEVNLETIRRRLGSNSEVTWKLHGGFENVFSCLIFGIHSEAFGIVFQYSKLLFRNSKLWFPNNYSEIPSLTWNFYTRVTRVSVIIKLKKTKTSPSIMLPNLKNFKGENLFCISIYSF